MKFSLWQAQTHIILAQNFLWLKQVLQHVYKINKSIFALLHIKGRANALNSASIHSVFSESSQFLLLIINLSSV